MTSIDFKIAVTLRLRLELCTLLIFTCEVWTKGGLTTCYVLFYIHLKTRRVVIGGVSENPDDA